MKASELRQKTGEELSALLKELSKEQFNLRMQRATNQLSKSDGVKKARKDVARILTVIKENAGR